jgi:hypothetical protein
VAKIETIRPDAPDLRNRRSRAGFPETIGVINLSRETEDEFSAEFGAIEGGGQGISRPSFWPDYLSKSSFRFT